MINHNSNLIESQFANAGSGSLFLEYALVYLLDSDYPGSGSWYNRVGNAITTSGSFVDSGSAGWGFNASARLNLGESVPEVTFNPFVKPEGITFIMESQLGSYTDTTTKVLTINSLDGSTFSIPGGYSGTSYEYRQSGSIMTMKNSNDVEDIPDFVSSSVNLYSLTIRPDTGGGLGPALLYFNDDGFVTVSALPGETLGFYQNDKPVVFGNFANQTVVVNPTFFTLWQRYRGTLKTLLIYNRALTDTQLRVVFNNLRRGV